MLEAVVLEKALALKTKKNTWEEVAETITRSAGTRAGTDVVAEGALGDGSAFHVSLEADALRCRFTRVFKSHDRAATVARAQKKAIAILSRY